MKKEIPDFYAKRGDMACSDLVLAVEEKGFLGREEYKKVFELTREAGINYGIFNELGVVVSKSSDVQVEIIDIKDGNFKMYASRHEDDFLGDIVFFGLRTRSGSGSQIKRSKMLNAKEFVGYVLLDHWPEARVVVAEWGTIKSDNLEMYEKGIEMGLSEIESAKQTWTSKLLMSGKLGFEIKLIEIERLKDGGRVSGVSAVFER